MKKKKLERTGIDRTEQEKLSIKIESRLTKVKTVD